jgi:hypothetical protein
MNKLKICLLQRVRQEGLISETDWLCSAHDILKTNCNTPNYIQENIKHITLRIG